MYIMSFYRGVSRTQTKIYDVDIIEHDGQLINLCKNVCDPTIMLVD